MTDIVRARPVQEIEGIIIGSGRADELLDEAEEYYASALSEHGLAYTNDQFDETVERLERIRALRAGENANRAANRWRR